MPQLFYIKKVYIYSMMKAIDRIKSFIISTNELFPVLKFRYGFGSTEHTYIVEVKPLEEFNNNEDYAKMERDFCVSFQKEYNEDDVIFVSEDDLIAVKDVMNFGYTLAAIRLR